MSNEELTKGKSKKGKPVYDVVRDGVMLAHTFKDAKTGKILVSIDPRHFRPAEVELLLGDPTRAERDLGWTAKTPLPDLVSEMVQHDLAYDSYGGK